MYQNNCRSLRHILCVDHVCCFCAVFSFAFLSLYAPTSSADWQRACSLALLWLLPLLCLVGIAFVFVSARMERAVQCIFCCSGICVAIRKQIFYSSSVGRFLIMRCYIHAGLFSFLSSNQYLQYDYCHWNHRHSVHHLHCGFISMWPCSNSSSTPCSATSTRPGVPFSPRVRARVRRRATNRHKTRQ